MLRWTLGCTCLFQIWFPRCVCPEVGLLGHMAVLFPDMSFFECMYWRYFLLICVLCLHFLSGSFVSSVSFDFNKFQLISFYGWGYGLSTKFWPALKSQKIPTFSSRSFISLDFTVGLWPTLSFFLCTVLVSKVLFFFSISISRCPSTT